MRRISTLSLLLLLVITTPGKAALGTDDAPNPVRRLAEIIRHFVQAPLDGLISVPKP